MFISASFTKRLFLEEQVGCVNLEVDLIGLVFWPEEVGCSAEDDVTEIQVAVSSSEAQPVLGKHVKISDTLFHAIVAHHRTKVIMINESMNKIE